MLQEAVIRLLEEKARAIRIHIISMLGEAGSGHPGGSLSAADIMAVLYFHHLDYDPARPDWEQRDRFVLSKGHAAPVLYGTLAEAGFFPVQELDNLRKLGHMLQGHPDSNRTPGVEVSSGSLGQGLAIANGIALGAKLNGDEYRVYVLMGDGEMQEGMIWEAGMSAAHYGSDNLVGIIDHNGLQIDGPTTEVCSPEPLAEKWRAFGWHVIEVDGHDFNALAGAFEEAEKVKGKPSMIIADTIKGKGVSFMENKADWHGSAPNKDQTQQALKELSE